MPWPETRIQRSLTIDFITKKRLPAPTIWLQPESVRAAPDDAIKTPEDIETNLSDWLEETEERNLGVRLVNGFIELRIKSPDDTWAKCLFSACSALRVDARAAYGVKGKPISSLILAVADPTSIEPWRERWPRGHKDKINEWVEAKFAYSMPATKTAAVIWFESAPLPGSRFAGGLVQWRPWGKPAAVAEDLGREDLEPYPVQTTNMESICRAIAFATLAYWIRIYLEGLEQWDESLTRIIGGWTARLIREGRDINARGKSLEGLCWSPIDSEETAQKLIQFLRTELKAGRDLEVAFAHATAALERNALAPIPGWGAIETLFGPQAKVGIRRAFRAGKEIDIVERMSDRYVRDNSDHIFLDREALLLGNKYDHTQDLLLRQWANEHFFTLNGKPLNPFMVYANSSLRVDVERREFRPGSEPASILRFSRARGLLANEEDQRPDEYRIFNTFGGFAIKPIAMIDQAIMGPAISMLDTMLGLLTRDNDAQMWWIKKFIAWMLQHPEIKAQVCPIIVGGQGIGKSIFGETLMRALIGTMAGTADAASLSENKFLITPFIGKLLTFIDEVRLENVSTINIIKKLVRSDYVSGQVKYGHQQDHYIPSRLLIASNQPDIGLTPQDAADRAFFFIVSWTAENKKMTDREFQTWSLTLKPFYTKFVRALESVPLRQHLMRYFLEIEVSREELEDLKHSSRDDENVVRATMSRAREVARAIVADARVIAGNDLSVWFTVANLREAIKRVDGPRSRVEPGQVLLEYERAAVIETVRGDLRKFRYKYATLVEKLGEAHSLPITPNWDYEPDDWGSNTWDSPDGGKPWRGNRQRSKKKEPKAEEAPPESTVVDVDFMPDF